LLLRRQSTISTTAGLAQAWGNGGNITITAPRGFIVGVKTENSDITANAFTGNGGRVTITAQGVYGLQFRPQLTPFSDITASSTFGISGVVDLNILGIDPTRSLFVLPSSPLDITTQFDDRCSYHYKGRATSFIVTGRGGYPTDPADILRDEESQLQDTDWIDEKEVGLRSQESKVNASQSTGATGVRNIERNQESEDGSQELEAGSHPPQTPSTLALSQHHTLAPASPPPIIEANNWIVAPDGTVWLVAEVPAEDYESFRQSRPCLLQRTSQPEPQH
jgi:large exoprotein involved in heme utilization and adhesion